MTETTGTELALSPDLAPADVFANSRRVDATIEAVRKMAEEQAAGADIATKKGRDLLRSLAATIARTKTAMDEAGKKLNEEARSQINLVDAERRKIRDELDALRDKVRKPLTDWEAAEEARLKALQDRLTELQSGTHRPITSAAEAQALLDDTVAIRIDTGWDELATDAMVAKDAVVTSLTQTVKRMRQDEADRAELQRLRDEQARREAEEAERREAEAESKRKADEAAAAAQAERDRLAREAEARANRANMLLKQIEERAEGRMNGNPTAANVLLHDLMDRMPKEMVDLQDKHDHVEMARQHAITKVQAIEAAERAETERAFNEAQARAAEEAAERERRAAAQREADLRAEAERAAQAERDRQAAERKAEQDAADRRAADTAHRARIHTAIRDALETITSNAAMADDLAGALMDGRIPHVEVRL